MKDKQYYINRYNAFFDNHTGDSEELNHLFEEEANAEEVAGYYIAIYEDQAYRQWSENLLRVKMWHGKVETEQDQQTTKILKELFE